MRRKRLISKVKLLKADPLASAQAVRGKATLQRIRSLVIPPARESVWICPLAFGAAPPKIRRQVQKDLSLPDRAT